MAAKPLVLPDSFSGETSWDEWICHFENVADVNSWNNEQKLKWLRVRLIGRAQKAYQRLGETVRSDYRETRKALAARFEPESKKTRYQAEFQIRRKKKSEGWADFAEDLRSLADKAYPELQDEARETLALSSFLAQLDQPQVAFSVKQKRPETLDDAVTATLEMESYVSSKMGGAPVSSVTVQDAPAITAAVTAQDRLAELVEKLAERVERLETASPKRYAEEQKPQVSDRGRRPAARQQTNGSSTPNGPGRSTRNRRISLDVVCWTCGRRGHVARDCHKPQGN